MWEVGVGQMNRQIEEISETHVSDRLSYAYMCKSLHPGQLVPSQRFGHQRSYCSVTQM